MTSARLLAFALVAVSTGSLGCSALTHPPSDEIACVLGDDGTDPCVELDRVCVLGFCRSREDPSGTSARRSRTSRRSVSGCTPRSGRPRR